MQIVTDIELGDKVYVLHQGKVVKGPVIAMYAMVTKPQHLREIWGTLPHRIRFTYDVDVTGVSIRYTGDDVYRSRDDIIAAIIPA